MVCSPKNSYSRKFPTATWRRNLQVKMSSVAKSSHRDCTGNVYDEQSRCTLCREHLRGAHSHPGQWKCELQQFLLKYTEIPMSACVCKPCERSIRRGLGGKFLFIVG